MAKTKRMLCIFLVALMLFTSLPMNAFAEEITTLAEENTTAEMTTDAEDLSVTEETVEETTVTEEAPVAETEYLIGKDYTIDGVEYSIDKNGIVKVTDVTEDVAEVTEILAYLGDYPVTSIEYTFGFLYGKNIKELIIPETVTVIDSLNLENIEKLEIRNKYAVIKDSGFPSSAPIYKDESNWHNGLFIIDSFLIRAVTDEPVVVIGEEITSVASGCFGYNKKIEEIKVYNSNCSISRISDTFPPDAVIWADEGSTAESYAVAFGRNFQKLCRCEERTVVAETKSYCDGRIGYTKGVYCENCQIWESGHRLNTEVNHFDENEDLICDKCEVSLEINVVASGIAGDTVCWVLYDEGTIGFYGTGDIYEFGTYDVPWGSYGQDGMIKRAVIGEGIVKLEGNYFCLCKGFDTAVLSDTVESITGTFFNCSSLRTVIMSENIKSIGKETFAYCYALEDISLPESLTFIGENAFRSCRNLKQVYIPDSIKSIESGVFAYCNALESVEFAEDLEEIGREGFRNCTSLESFVMPDTVVSMGSYAFYGCRSLTEIKLSDSLRGISSSAFEKCTSLKKITIPEKVVVLGDYAFCDCTELDYIEFKNGYMQIGWHAFDGTAAYNNPDNIKDGILYINNCLIKEIDTETPTLVLGTEITSIAESWYKSQSKITKVIIYNPNCVFPDTTAGIPSGATFEGLVGSTAEKYSQKFNSRFSPFCICEDTIVTVPESNSYCDGSEGYTEGVWCERCKLWVSGHVKKSEILHIDENEDEICDYCKAPTGVIVVKTGKCGENINWYYTKDDELLLVGSGEMYNYDYDSDTDAPVPPWSQYRGTAKAIKLSDEITSVGDYAFYGFSVVESISLSPIILTIGTYSFYNCKKLTSLQLPETVYKISELAFYNCNSLSGINLGEKLTVLEDYAFYNCTSLKSIVIPKSLKSLPVGMFYLCTGLESVEIKSSTTTIRDYAFYGCASLSEFKSVYRMSSIGAYAFYGCKSLSEFSGESVSSMGSYAFSKCESLKAINLKNLKVVGERAFKSCTSLESVVFGKLTQLGTSAFLYCTSLKSVVLPESVTKVSTGAFGGCDSLAEITFMNDKTEISRTLLTDGTKKLTAVPLTATIKANCGSTADSYADNYSISFEPFEEKMIASVKLTAFPEQLVYFIDKDTAFSKNGAVIKVTYDDGTSVSLKNRFTVDWKDADIGKAGIYNPVIIYKGYEFPFEISVLENYVFTGIPESRVFGDIYCKKGEWIAVTVIPQQTAEYRFCFSNTSDVEIDTDITKHKFNGVTYTDKQTYQKDTEYTFHIKAISESKTVRLFETDDIYFEMLDNGTYEAKFSLTGGDIVIPSEYGGIPVTKVADDFIKNCAKYNSVTVSEGITEIGSQAFASCKKKVILPESIEVIGSKAFYLCDGLTGILTIGASVKKISGYAFSECNSLTGLVLKGEGINVGDYAFASCVNLKEVTVASADNTYGKKVFYDCKILKKVTLNNHTKSFGVSMFSGCQALEEINGTEGIIKIENGTFSGCLSLSDVDFISGVKDIGSGAFSGCKSIEEIKLNKDMTEISDSAFSGCTGLKKIEVPENVTRIGESAFSNCSGVTELILGNKLKEIGKYAFRYMSFESISLPDSVEVIGNSCFNGCKALKEFTMPEGFTAVPSFCFQDCSSLESFSSETDITVVNIYAFSGCSKLKTVDFWDTVTKVDVDAFEMCASLTSAPFEKVSYIGTRAFYRCLRLKSVNFPLQGTIINERAFYGCTSLKEIDIKENSTVSLEAFAECLGLEKITLRDNVNFKSNSFNGNGSLKDLYLFTAFDTHIAFFYLPSDVTFHGYSGSSAEAYANRNGYKFVSVEGHSHSYTLTTTPASDCRTRIYNVYSCACGYSYQKEVSDWSTRHHYSDFTTDKEPTCTEPGVKSKHCYCGKNRSDITVIEPLGHTEIIDIPAVAPTATEPGYTHQSHCSVCGETVVKRELISHSEYDILVDDSEVTAYKFDAATPENDGEDVVITFKLKNNVYLSYIDKTVIYKVGEVKLSKTELTYNGKVQKPAVTVKDSTGEKLTLNRDYRVTYSADSKYCGEYSVKVDYIGNYAGNKTLYYDIVHNWGVGEITKSPTCTKTGIKTFTCGCGVSYTETIVKLGHLYSNACDTICNRSGCGTKRTITHNYAAATCTTAKKCKVCGATSGNKLGHSYSNACDTTCNTCSTKRTITHSYKSVTTKATLTKNGKIETKCSVCGKVSKTVTVYYPKSIKLSKTSYTYNGKVQTPSISVKDSKGNTLKKDTDYTVKYESGRKAAGAYTVAITFKGKYSGTKKLTYTIAPKATSKVTASQTTSTITLKWSKVTGADGYRIYKYSTKTKKWDTVKTVSASTLNYKIKDLKAGTAYKYRVRAYTKDDGTIWGAYSSTFETATKCKTPSIIKLTTTRGKASFTWSNVSGESGYQVYYSTKKDSGYKKVASYKANIVKGSKSKLKSGKKYYFKVRAYKKVDGKTVYGSFSSVKSIKIK